MTRRVVAIQQRPGGPVVDLVRVPWTSRERWAAYCRDCKKVVELNQVTLHKQTTEHKRLVCIAVPESHRHSTWCAPLCGPGTVPARRTRSPKPTPKIEDTGPTYCFFGLAHAGVTGSATCPNCGASAARGEG